MDMPKYQRILWPVGTGLLGSTLLTGLYFGIISWVERLPSSKWRIDL